MSVEQISVAVTDASQVGDARRRAAKLAEVIGLNETDRGKVAIVATELATNLARHAQGGELLLRAGDSASGGLELLSVDHGPGMADVHQCLEDGYSTNGTAGNGLGAIRRLANEFDVGSSRPAGTVIYARIGDVKTSGSRSPFVWGAVSRPVAGETRCGDAWQIAQQNDTMVVMMVDGLGHGDQAADAAELALAAFDEQPFAPLAEIAQRIDRQMRGSRGGALALARIDLAEGILRYVGVGNIAGRLLTPGGNPARGLVSHNGTMGVQVRKIQEFNYPLSANSILIMHSDGLQQRWLLDQYAGWSRSHPAVLAGMLYRDFTRGRDDVTVVAVRVLGSTEEK